MNAGSDTVARWRCGAPGGRPGARRRATTAPGRTARRREHASTPSTRRTPRHLDPTASYSVRTTRPYTYQVYEPPYGYHYLKRPFELVPKAAPEVVAAVLPRQGRPAAARRRAGRADRRERLRVPIKPRHPVRSRIRPSPRTRKGRYLYHRDEAAARSATSRSPLDFEHQGTRELVAEDFVYALKRHATTRIKTPSSRVFAEYVVGLKEYGETDQGARTPSCCAGPARPTSATSPSSTSAAGRWPAPRRPTRTCCASASRASTRSGSTGWR